MDAFSCSPNVRYERKKAHAKEEIGDQFDSERPEILLLHIKVEFWRRKSEEECIRIAQPGYTMADHGEVYEILDELHPSRFYDVL